jgi:glycosyltransferase involved in cell wall biosynthesis
MNGYQFKGRLGLQQRLLPSYRVPFFDALAAACTSGMSLFAGQPMPGEAIQTGDRPDLALYVPARNLNFGRVGSPGGSPFYLCWQAGLTRWLESWQPDALIVEANPRYISTRLACAWMRSRSRPVLGWGLGAPQGMGLWEALRGPGRRRFLSQFDGLIAYSQRGADEYRGMGFPAGRIFVAPNAVAPRPAHPPKERPPAFTRRPVVLFVGRLQARKRIDNLLLACALMPPELQPEVCIVGDGPAMADLRAAARQVYPQARFLGAKRGAELETYFSATDLFVLPGTGGLAVQEAMAHGLPVIVAEGDGTQDDLVRPENGWRVPPGDLEALVETLREALSDAARLRRMGRESYRIVAEEANIERMVDVFIQALNTVMGLPSLG